MSIASYIVEEKEDVLKRIGSLRLNSAERSDSETDQEDCQLTQAALQRLERRNQITSRNSLRRRGKIESDSTVVNIDENNNDLNASKFETSSDKTLDSGIFDLALVSLSEDICKLSERYNSNEYLLDGFLSPKSGYSSATESLAESIAESYYSTDDTIDMETRKKRVLKFKAKPDKSNIKTAVLNNASRIAKGTAGKKLVNNETKTVLNVTPLKKNEQTISTNKRSESTDNVNKKLYLPNPVLKSSNLPEKDCEGATAANKGKQINRRESQSKLDKTTDRKKSITSNSPNKKQLSSKVSESPPLRKESIHSKTCNSAERMSNLSNLNYNSPTKQRKESIKQRRESITSRKESVVGPATRNEENTSKFAKVCLSPTQLNKKGIDSNKDQNQVINLQVKGGTDESLIKIDQQHTSDTTKSINDGSEFSNENKKIESNDNISCTNKMEKITLKKFSINRERCSIDETNSKNRLIHQGRVYRIKYIIRRCDHSATTTT